MGLQNLLDSLSGTIHRDAVNLPAASAASKALEKAQKLYPYALTPRAHSFLSTQGITLPVEAPLAHSHPTHKTLEIHLLNEVLPSFVRSECTVYFMKPEKFSTLQSKFPQFTQLRNSRYTIRDKTRYPKTDLRPADTDNAFFHDALHYWTLGEMSHFLAHNPAVSKVFGSICAPIELLLPDHGSLNSFNPKIYSLNLLGDEFVYRLENAVESYQQNIETTLAWLLTSRVSGPVEFHIEVLRSFGPMHLICISRNTPAVPQEFLHLGLPECVEIPAPDHVQSHIRDRLVPRAVYDQAYQYVRAVRTLRVTDPAGFIRTHMSKECFDWVTLAAWDNLTNFILQTAEIRPRTTHSLFPRLWDRFVSWLNSRTRLPFFLFSLVSTPFLLGSYCLSRKLANHRLLFRSPVWFTNGPGFLPHLHFCSPVMFKARAPCYAPLLHFLRRWAPASRSFIPSRFSDRRYYWLFAAAIAFSASAWLCTTVFTLQPLQQSYDEYHRYFHRSNYQLSVPRSTRSVPSLQQPFGDHTSIASTVLSPLVASSVSGIEKAKLSSPISPASDPLKTEPHSTPPITLPALAPLVAPVESQEPLPTPPPPKQAVPSHLTPPAAPEPPLPNPPTIPPPPQSASGMAFAPPVLSGEALATHDDANLTHQSTPPRLDDPPPAPLSIDPSSSGPITPWCVLYAYEQNDYNCFPSRLRSSPKLPPYPPVNDCLFRAVGSALSLPASTLWTRLAEHLPDSQLSNPSTLAHGYDTDHLAVLASVFNVLFTVVAQGYAPFNIGPPSAKLQATIYHTPGHWSASPLLSGASVDPQTDRFTELEEALLSYRSYDGAFLPFLRFHDHTTDSSRAKCLASNLKNQFDGVLRQVLLSSGDPKLLHRFDAVAELARPRQVRVAHLAGFAGCGKSAPLIKFFRGSKWVRHLRVAVPNNDLREHWKTSLRVPENERWRISTWETSLTRRSSCVILDEVYKLPPGYLDLLCTLDTSVRLVIILGDPIQGSYHSVNPDSTLKKLLPENEHLKKYIDLYCGWTYRSPRNIARALDVECLSPETGEIYHTRNVNGRTPILAAGLGAATTLHLSGSPSQTVASSQGLTLNHVKIFVDKGFFQLTNNLSLVAVTRHKKTLGFIGNVPGLRTHKSFNEVFSCVLENRVKPLSSWPELQGLRILRSPLTSRHPKLSGAGGMLSYTRLPATPRHWSAPDITALPAEPLRLAGPDLVPNLPTEHLPETRAPLHFAIDSAICPSPRPQSDTPSSTAIEPVYPGVDSLLAMALFATQLPPADELEIDTPFGRTAQFPNQELYSEGAVAPNLIAPWHQPAKDPTLLPMSIEKRLRFRPSPSPYQLTDNDRLLGLLLYNAWAPIVGLNPDSQLPFNPELFADCICDNEYHQLSSKTKATIAANASRSDPTWRHTVVRIFAKSQHKINENSLFTGVKACQTLALAHDAVILLLGPVKKYQRLVFSRYRPAHVFIYASHTPVELSEWCARYFPPNTTRVCNDYSAFDQSQGGEAVVFELYKMQLAGIPSELQSLHLKLKTEVECQFGPLTSMRLTGEPGTYDDNTDYNIAVLASRFDLRGIPFCVSGDDSSISRVPKESHRWAAVAPMLSVRFKIEYSPEALFCGYYVSHLGAVRAPRALFAKLYVAHNDGSIDDKLASYLTEFAIGHSLGDALWEVLPFDQHYYQACCFDYFCRHAPKHLKDSLKIGEAPSLALELVGDSLKHLSRPLWFMLPSSVRYRLRHLAPALVEHAEAEEV